MSDTAKLFEILPHGAPNDVPALSVIVENGVRRETLASQAANIDWHLERERRAEHDGETIEHAYVEAPASAGSTAEALEAWADARLAERGPEAFDAFVLEQGYDDLED